VNTLRLWAASAPDYFDFQEFSSGDFVAALAENLTAEPITRVLYMQIACVSYAYEHGNRQHWVCVIELDGDSFRKPMPPAAARRQQPHHHRRKHGAQT
jgi:Carbohydrate phosphorylase